MQKNQPQQAKEQKQVQPKWKHQAVWEKQQEVKLQEQKIVAEIVANSFQKKLAPRG